MGTKNNHSIRDLGLAAALVSAGHTVVTTEHEPSGRVSFIFTPSDELTEAINQYWSNQLTVPARTYSDNIKVLKNMIYERS